MLSFLFAVGLLTTLVGGIILGVGMVMMPTSQSGFSKWSITVGASLLLLGLIATTTYR